MIELEVVKRRVLAEGTEGEQTWALEATYDGHLWFMWRELDPRFRLPVSRIARGVLADALVDAVYVEPIVNGRTEEPS